MKEEYSVKDNAGRVFARATYDRFRRLAATTPESGR
jgi:hypothetical protein